MTVENNKLNSLPLLTWIYEIYLLGQKAALSNDPVSIQKELIENIIKRFDGFSGCLAEKHNDDLDLIIVAVVGLPDHVIGSQIEYGKGILGGVAKNGKPVLLEGNLSKNNENESNSEDRDAPRPDSAMCWPLIVDNEVTGVISINRNKDVNSFNNDDLIHGSNIIKFVSIALENARLHVRSNAYHKKQKELSEQQVIWSEALSWLNNSHFDVGENNGLEIFYSQAIAQAVLISNSKWGFIVECDNNQAVAVHLSKQKIMNENTLLNIFNKTNIFEEFSRLGLYYLTSDVISTNESWKSELLTLLPGNYVISRVVMENFIPSIFVLSTDDNINNFFDDNVSYCVFIDGVKKVIEHRMLLASLKSTNEELAEEKNEQKALIAELKEAQNQLLQSEKLASIGQLAAGVAHEINNPVGYISSNISSLKNYIDDIISLIDLYSEAEAVIENSPEIIQRIKSLKEEIDIDFLKEDIKELTNESLEGVSRVKQIVQDLKDFSHVDEAEWQWADVHMGLDSTINVVSNEIKYKADVIKEYGDLPQIECIPSQLNQVFMNILVNAAHAIEGDRGVITIKTGVEEGMAWFEFIDTGKGIEQDKMNKIFDPFFTTKPVGKGTGLGLSLSYGIIEAHKGKIDVQSEVGNGATFRISIPIKSTAGNSEEPVD